MKKYILLFAILLASCSAPVEEPKGSGMWAGDENETFTVGSDEMTEDEFNEYLKSKLFRIHD